MKVGFINIVNPLSSQKSIQIDGANNSGNLRLYTSKGHLRYWLTVEKGSPVARFYNKSSRAVVGLGAFNDDNKGFLRIFDPINDKIVAEVSEGKDGGRSIYFTQDGKQLVYIGPAQNTGDALIKLNSRYGDKEKEFDPNN